MTAVHNVRVYKSEENLPREDQLALTGWTAHIMKQLASNSLIRPLSEYNGPDERAVSSTHASA